MNRKVAVEMSGCAKKIAFVSMYALPERRIQKTV